MTREQIGRALEYKSERQIDIIHSRNQESLDGMSVEVSRFERVHQNDVDLSSPENKRNTQTIDDLMLSKLQPNTLLYNEDGIYEITFLSRQPRANEFRAWVRENQRNQKVKRVLMYCVYCLVFLSAILIM